MKSFSKLPLYLGLAVLVISVLISAVKVGNEQAFTSGKTSANVSGTALSIKYTFPNMVSVLLTGDMEIKGADVVLKYNAEKLSVLPSSLTGGSNITVIGGIADEEKNTFSFSAISKDELFKNGVLATFSVKSKSGGSTEGDIQFAVPETQVIAKDSSQNILKSSQGIRFILSDK